MTNKTLPSHARVVIIGGGVIGCSIAYHLTKLGCRDVVLLERRSSPAGTTWHAAGLLTSLRDTETQTRLAKYSQDLYRNLEAETGQATGLIGCGSIQLAMTRGQGRGDAPRHHMAHCFGVEAHEISPRPTYERLWPLAEVDDLTAAFYFPNDGRVNPTDVTQALAKGARMGGARDFRKHRGDRHHSAIGGPRSRRAHRRRVTIAGRIRRQLRRHVGARGRAHGGRQCAAAGGRALLPDLRARRRRAPDAADPARSGQLRLHPRGSRQDHGRAVRGAWRSPGERTGIPEDFRFGEIPPDWERMYPHIEKAMRRVPCLLETGIKLLFCGPESFTPDHNYLMGEAPNLKNFFVAAGFNSLGILSGGGAGLVMAHWIAGGPRADGRLVGRICAAPMRGRTTTAIFRIARSRSLGIGYQDHWPFRQWTTARGVKKSVLHDRLAAAGACFGESAGWERPNWYARPGRIAAYEYGWGRQNWFSNNAEEHRAVRERVGVFEQSSFAKLLVAGSAMRVEVLNRIATANVDVAVGRCVYTQFLNAARAASRRI